MKTFFLRATLSLLAIAFSLLSGKAAPATNAITQAKVVASNAIPESVFTTPPSRKEGCDPFFPNSARLWGMTAVASTKPTKPAGAECLVLKGLSGATGNPLAIINGRTMSRGEDAEINTDCGRLSVHCVDITANSVVIEVAGERRELHLRSDF